MFNKIVHEAMSNVSYCMSVLSSTFSGPAMTELERRDIEKLTDNEAMFLNIVGY